MNTNVLNTSFKNVQLPFRGGNYGYKGAYRGTWPDMFCPTGEVLVGTRSNNQLICSDGTVITAMSPNWGSRSDGPYSTWSSATTYSKKWGEHLINPFANGLPNPTYTDKCPSGMYVNGFNNIHRDAYIQGISATCGYYAKEFCVNNLEDSFCRNQPASVLNEACSLKITPTCINRKKELNDSTVAAYCKNNPKDIFCSCYSSPPSAIPQEISGIPQCWSQACATSGYIPTNLRNQSCPPVTICTQNFVTAGSQNQLTQNINLIDCSRPTTVNVPPSSSSIPTQVIVTPTDEQTNKPVETQVTSILGDGTSVPPVSVSTPVNNVADPINSTTLLTQSETPVVVTPTVNNSTMTASEVRNLISNIIPNKPQSSILTINEETPLNSDQEKVEEHESSSFNYLYIIILIILIAGLGTAAYFIFSNEETPNT